MNENIRSQVQAELYAKGLGSYRGWIVEYDADTGWWMAGYSLLTGAVFTTENIADVLAEIDRREDA